MSKINSSNTPAKSLLNKSSSKNRHQAIFDGKRFLDNTQYFNKGDVVIVEEVLKNSSFQLTKKIYISAKNGSRKGPYILKEFNKNYTLGSSYTKLLDNDCDHLPNVYYADSVFVIEEYICGKTLDLINYKSCKLTEIIGIFKELCNAVVYLHENFEKPIIHRDIKPSNILIEKNNIVYLLDFGIARQYDKNKKFLQDTQKLGTVGFAPPEQYGFSQTDVRSDVYSLGKVLQYMLSNIDKNSLVSSEVKIYNLLNIIINKACSFDPKNRYSTVKNLLKDINIAEDEVAKSLFFSPSNDKVNNLVYRLGVLWNLILTIFWVFMEGICVYVIFFDGSSDFSQYHFFNKLLAAFCIMIFIYIPVFYILLFKPNIKKLKVKFPKILGWFPILRRWQQIVFLIICFLAALICGGLASVFA